MTLLKPEISKWQELAPELISRIISHFLDDQELVMPVFAPHKFPWYLGHICSAWRAVFESSPEYWSEMVIDFDGEESGDLVPIETIARGINLLEICLCRSKTHPLSFEFRYNTSVHPHDHESFKRYHDQILNTLMAHTIRWRDVYFHVPNRVSIPALYYGIHRLPILRSLQLTHTEIDDIDYGIKDMLKGASQLRRVWFSGYPVWKIDWSLLTTFRLDWTFDPHDDIMTLGNLVELLRKMDHLEDLFLDGSFSTRELPRVMFPCLKSLGASDMRLFPMFETPRLEKLSIADTFIDDDSFDHQEDYHDWQELFEERVSSFLKQPMNHLRELVLRADGVGHVTTIFQYLPTTIEDLYIYTSDCSIPRAIPLCPSARQLKTILVGWPSYRGVHPHVLANLLEVARFWEMRSNTTNGIGYFEELKSFTLELQDDLQHCTEDEYFTFNNNFRDIFVSRGVRCDVWRIAWDGDYYGLADPQFIL